jgi:hypothetical protein
MRCQLLMKGLLVLLALVASLFTAIGLLTFLLHVSCDRLDAVGVSYLGPGT